MKETCSICQGSGEIAYFKGESRFVLSHEDCPVCGGLGYVIKGEEDLEDLKEEPDLSPTPSAATSSHR